MQFALGPEAQAAGYRLESYETVASTNAEALSRLRDGDEGHLWVVSAHQSAGRGRRGNRWENPVGNLAASLGLVVGYPASTAARLGFVAGLALDRALRLAVPSLGDSGATSRGSTRSGPAEQRLRLKWPNDLLLDGGKLAGILLEAEPLADGRLAVIVGIGVNVIAAPDGLPYRASSVASLKTDVDAAEIFLALSDSWVAIDRLWCEGEGFHRIRECWLERAAGTGEEVTVKLGGNDRIHGVFESIDDAGCLILRLRDGSTRSISAGAVHFSATMAASV